MEALKVRLGSWILALVPLIQPWCACSRTNRNEVPPKQAMPQRDINAVLNDHVRDLMAIPGVVGVYVGLMDDGKTSCLKVMVVEKTPEIERRIPKILEGYAVVPEESGVIRPMPEG